jgi:large subunit ribosomal protein L21
MYAVIKTGGKQYKVEQGQTLNVELLGEEIGANVTFAPVLVVDGERVVALPAELASASVTAKVVGEAAGPKIIGYMYKSKARAQRKWGHRQHYTTVEVTSITA